MEYFHMYFVLFVIWKYFSIKILKKLASEKKHQVQKFSLSN